MPRKRKWTDEQLMLAVKNNTSVSGVIMQLKMKLAGGTHAVIKHRIKQLELDNSHFTGSGWCNGDHHINFVNRFVKMPLEKILTQESTYQNTSALKKRLLQEGLLFNKCYVCNCNPTWNELPLVLQLDHINGKRIDNRIVNLRLLCPNCHSQTASFAGKNRDKNKNGRGA